MDAEHFDSLTTHLTTTRTRRGIGLLGLAGIAGTMPAAEVQAGKRKKRKRKNKRGRRSPTTTPDASCTGAGVALGNLPRFAQTFRARRSGELTSATVFLRENAAGSNFDVEIWSVDQANTPNAVLAGATVANVPQTQVADPARPLTVTFASPARIVAGLRYAVVLTGKQGALFYTEFRGNDVCPDGNLFFSVEADGVFTSDPNWDMHFETFVTA